MCGSNGFPRGDLQVLLMILARKWGRGRLVPQGNQRKPNYIKSN